MKRGIKCIILICMIAIIGGCSSNNKKNNTNSDLEKQSKINIEDIDWKVRQGIVDGDRYALLDYTNNTPYTITHFELTFEEKDDLKEETLKILAYGTLSPNHAGQFIAFIKQIKNRYRLSSIISGDESWPNKPEDRDVLYFLAQSFRAQIIKELPSDKKKLNENSQYFAHRAKALIKDLSLISLEIAQMVVGNVDENSLPNWFMIEIVRDLPRLVEKKNG